jgi:hypothetical protein
MEIFAVWIILALVVGVAASSRGRSGFGWFLVSLIFSPLIGGLFVLAARNLKQAAEHEALVRTAAGARPGEKSFTPDGVMAGIPYRTERAGAVTAMMPGGRVEFRSMAQFKAAAGGQTIDNSVPSEIAQRFPQEHGAVRYRIEKNGNVAVWEPTGEEFICNSWYDFRHAYP